MVEDEVLLRRTTIYAQRIDAAGYSSGTLNGVAALLREWPRKIPTIAADGAGGAFVSGRTPQRKQTRTSMSITSARVAMSVGGGELSAPGWTTRGRNRVRSCAARVVLPAAPDGALEVFESAAEASTYEQDSWLPETCTHRGRPLSEAPGRTWELYLRATGPASRSRNGRQPK